MKSFGRAVELANDLVALMADQEAIGASGPHGYWGFNVIQQWKAAATGAASARMFAGPAVVEPTDPGWRDRVQQIGQDAAARTLWSRHRIVYAVDPTLWTELAETDDDTSIPDGLMRRLPHPDPFVAFPAPMVLPCGDGEVMLVEGFFVNGRANLGSRGDTLTSTHADDANGDLGLLFAGAARRAGTGEPVLTSDGVPEYILTRVTMNTGRGAVTVAQMIEETRPRFKALADVSTGFDAVPPLLRAATAALVYLCATNSDLGESRQIGRPAQRRVMGGKAEVVPVGYHVGAAIRQAEADVRRAGGNTVRVSGARGPMRPHLRKAHFHRYRIGPGRREVTVKWLEPIPVNIGADGATTPTVVPVR